MSRKFYLLTLITYDSIYLCIYTKKKRIRLTLFYWVIFSVKFLKWLLEMIKFTNGWYIIRFNNDVVDYENGKCLMKFALLWITIIKWYIIY